MLDKSIEFKNIIMRCNAEKIANLPAPSLPAGYSIRSFVKGDEINWVRIEASVLEFASEADALDFFYKSLFTL